MIFLHRRSVYIGAMIGTMRASGARPLPAFGAALLLLSACAAPASRRQNSSGAALLAESKALVTALSPRIRDTLLGAIAHQQAQDRRYREALATLRGVASLRDYYTEDYVIAASIQNNDLNMAQAMIAELPEPRSREQELSLVADQAAAMGDNATTQRLLKVLPPYCLTGVLQAKTEGQAQRGDFDGALATAARIPPEPAAADGEPGPVDMELWDIASYAQKAGDKIHVQEAVHRMSQPQRDDWLRNGTRPVKPPPDACDRAAQQARAGQFTLAANAPGCSCEAVAGAGIASGDSALAEAVMQACADPNRTDYSPAYAHLAESFAARGDLTAALRFTDAARRAVTPPSGDDFVASADEQVAYAWARRGPVSTALQWARTRPNPLERAWSLLGVAIAVDGHDPPF